ncbi:ATP-binding cassette domain-containing protein [Microbacterium amylolyticum]|uniref:Peptide/nickel transport system ATP-binding protein n=1 Tax=Microbacterium amylolyticum TaxID=936337 RepID=A0ABS4ZDV9_9MICO|nr:ABC transporter ATP-binding protein [Microbacterium amylolyticum]MBP2435444.1 peptide/nickel transport system ATP-binding protein [Microbacterium amylolyticum]
MTLLRVQGLSVSMRGAGEILSRISLSVEPGSALGIVGESGAGKSVLARTLLGLTQAEPSARVSASELSFDGADLRRASQRTWRRLRGRHIGLVLQDALQSLDPLRTIEREVGESLAIQRVPRAERRTRVVAALTRAGLPDAASHLRQRSEDLSGGMRQRVLIASAIVGGTRLIIADEPTTALDATTAVKVLDLLSSLRDQGAGVILITHDVAAIRRVADHVAVLDRGRIVDSGTARRVLTSPGHATTQALLAAVPHGAKADTHVAQPSATPRLAARDITRRYGDVTAVDSVSLAVADGEVMGVVGESGSGKTTLARILVGQEQPDTGQVTHEGARIRLIPQDPLGSFDPRFTVERILRHARRSDAPEPAELLKTVGLDATVLRRVPRFLSGGQRQRVAIARALAARPDILVCDEPVSALDMTTQAGILNLLLDLQKRERLSMILISHDLAVVRKLSDRVIVMRHGRIVDEGTTEDVFRAPTNAFTRELIAASDPGVNPRS